MRQAPTVEVLWLGTDVPAAGAVCSLCNEEIGDGDGIVIRIRSSGRREIRAARLHHKCVGEVLSAVNARYEEFQAVAREAIDEAARHGVLGHA